ncbi:MAG TPA: radical SAM protein [Candidatus Deferrimicrobium sp.]|nr:radical SAM protein [Candidatus Deferrimicrobium sp.]
MLSSIFDIEFNPNKHLVHWDKIQALVQGKEIFPVTLELDISSACDHKCEWCVDPKGTHTHYLMPTQMAEKIMREAKSLGIQGIVFKGGGESTLHPEFAKILKIAGDLEFEIGVVTNGGRLNNQNLIDTLVRCAAYVRISIDGPTPQIRQAVHGRDDFDTLIAGLEKLVASRGVKRHPVIGATFCLDYSHRSWVDECIRLGEKLELDYVLIRPPFCEEVGFPAPYTPRQAAILRQEIRTAAENYQGKLKVTAGNWVGDQELKTFPLEKSPGEMARRDLSIRQLKYNGIEHDTGQCPASPLFLVVTAEGHVYGCCCLRGIENFSFGKIDYEENVTLKLILDSNRRKQCLERMRKVDCLNHCTHPFEKINALIEYLSLPRKYHSSFI